MYQWLTFTLERYANAGTLCFVIPIEEGHMWTVALVRLPARYTFLRTAKQIKSAKLLPSAL